MAESADRVARLAAALRALGVAAGDRVGIVALNYHEYLLAVPWAGAMVNPINIRWSPAEVVHALRESDTRTLFVDGTFANMVPEIAERFAGLSTVVYLGEDLAPHGMLDYEELVAAAEDELRAHCRQHIAGYKAPRSIEFADALPISGAGKVLKRELREKYWREEERQVH